MNAARRKGMNAEREVAAFLNDHLGVQVTRRYNLGTHEDIGDICGLDRTCIQVCDYVDLDRAVREKLPELEAQRVNAGAEFGALFARRRGGAYVVAQTPEQWMAMWREATA